MKASFFILYIAILVAMASCKPQSKEEKVTPAPEAAGDPVLLELEQDVLRYPDSLALYNRLMDTLAGRGRYLEAAAWSNKLIGRGEDSNFYYWYIKGDIFRRGKLYDSAIAAYTAYLQKFPDDMEILFTLGYTYAEAGDGTALELADALVRRVQTREIRSRASFIKGVYYNSIKEYDKARKWLDNCIALNYTYFEAYMEKGYSYYDQAKYEDALKSFLTLTRLNDSNADAWYWVAKSQEQTGKKKEAMGNYLLAYSLDNTIIEARDAAERLSRELGN